MQNDPLEVDIELLGQILRGVIELHEGSRVAKLVDRVVNLSGSRTAEEYDRLGELFADLDLPSTTVVAARSRWTSTSGPSPSRPIGPMSWPRAPEPPGGRCATPSLI